MKYYHDEAIRDAFRTLEFYHVASIRYNPGGCELIYAKIKVTIDSFEYYRKYYGLYVKLNNGEYYKVSGECLLETYSSCVYEVLPS